MPKINYFFKNDQNLFSKFQKSLPLRDRTIGIGSQKHFFGSIVKPRSPSETGDRSFIFRTSP